MLVCEEITEQIIGAAIDVHRALGPGLLESLYQEAMVFELERRSLHVQRQVEIPIVYKDQTLGGAFRLDLVVERTVVVELKAVDHVLPVHEAQLLSYLRLTDLPVGLLLNFNVAAMKQGITRRANTKYSPLRVTAPPR